VCDHENLEDEEAIARTGLQGQRQRERERERERDHRRTGTILNKATLATMGI
jgi:hypothetical protein